MMDNGNINWKDNAYGILIILFIIGMIAYYIGAGSTIYSALGGGRLGIWGVFKLL